MDEAVSSRAQMNLLTVQYSVFLVGSNWPISWLHLIGRIDHLTTNPINNSPVRLSLNFNPTLPTHYSTAIQEEETTRLQTAKRRLQREIDELTEQNETLTRDLANAKKSWVPYSSRGLCPYVVLFSSGGGRRATGLSSGISGGRSGRSARRQAGGTGGHSGQSANSGESLGDDDDDM